MGGCWDLRSETLFSRGAKKFGNGIIIGRCQDLVGLGRRIAWKVMMVGVCVVAVAGVQAENWGQWRGPRGDGVSADTQVPAEWSASKNIYWRTGVPGEGHSSPVVWGESVFLTSANSASGERLLLRYDRETGKKVWERVVLTAPVESMHRENSAASSTPVTDGTHVYTSFQNGKRVDIQCYNFTGERIWGVQPLQFAGEHGYSYTPIVHEDLVIFDFAQNDEAAVIALDKRTGKQRWRWDRPTREISHVTPLLVRSGRVGLQLIVSGSNQIRGFNPNSGESLWWCEGPTDVSVAGLATDGRAVFVAGGYPRRTRMAVEITGRGDVTGSNVRWKSTRAVSYVPSPVYHEGYLYTVIDDGMLTCVDVKSGDAVWEERLGGRFRSSLVLVAGKIYATNDKGVTTVFRATPERFDRVAVNDLGEFCYTTPAISGGRLYLRTERHLYSIGMGKPGINPARSE